MESPRASIKAVLPRAYVEDDAADAETKRISCVGSGAPAIPFVRHSLDGSRDLHQVRGVFLREAREARRHLDELLFRGQEAHREKVLAEVLVVLRRRGDGLRDIAQP